MNARANGIANDAVESTRKSTKILKLEKQTLQLKAQLKRQDTKWRNYCHKILDSNDKSAKCVSELADWVVAYRDMTILLIAKYPEMEPEIIMYLSEHGPKKPLFENIKKK